MIPRGHTLVVPNLWLKPQVKNLTDDQRVKIMSHLIGHFYLNGRVPLWWEGEVITAQYTGGPYPAIGYYAEETLLAERIYEIPDPLALENEMDAYIDQVGIEALIQHSASEPLTWSDIFARYRP